MSQDTTDDTVVTLEIDGAEGEYALDDLLNFDTTEIEENEGWTQAPAGVAEWRLTDASIGVKQMKDKDTDLNVNRLVVSFKLQAIAYLTVKGDDDPTKLAGTEHTESFYIKDLKKDIGRVKYFVGRIGLPNTGSPSVYVPACVNAEFAAAMKHTVDKNNKDRVFANLDMKSIKPITRGIEQAQTQQTTPVVQQAAKPAGLKLNINK